MHYEVGASYLCGSRADICGCNAGSYEPRAQQYSAKLFSGMNYRLIGPFRGGRALAVTGLRDQPSTYYFGSVAGGVWKTTDGGEIWKPIFDKEPIRLDRSNRGGAFRPERDLRRHG